MRRNLILLPFLLVLAGCASLTPQQCVQGDWQNIGYGDGVAGRLPDYINAHREACAEVGVLPDYQTWLRGYNAGLQAYCTPQNAYQRGRDGQSMAPVCPAESRPTLSYATDWGLQYYELAQEIRELRAEILRIQTVIIAELSYPDLTPEDADRLARLRFDMRQLERRIRLAELRQRRYAHLPY